MPITSGFIRYERRLPKDDANSWNFKHVVAEIHWVVDLGEDDDILADQAVYKAVSRVRDVLNWKPLEPAEVVLPAVLEPNLENLAAPNLAAQHPAAEITAGIPPALKRHRRTRAEMEAARAAQADPTLPQTSPTPEPETTGTAGSAEPGMPSFDPDPAPPAEVTDQALLDACQAKASSGKPVDAIRELVASFSPGGLVQTPQDARRRFLDELAKL